MEPDPIRDVLSVFAQQLCRRRKEKGLSLNRLSKLAGLDDCGLAKIEIGRTRGPRLETLIRCAYVLGVEPAELMPTLDQIREAIEQ